MDAKELIAALDAAENVVSADRAAALDDSLINTLDSAVKAARAALPSDAAQAPFVVTEIAAAEWAARHDIECNLKSFSTQRNAIEDARTMHLIDAAPVAADAAAPIDERAAFEALMRTGVLDSNPDFTRDDLGNYEDWDMQRTWRGWQARAAAPTPTVAADAAASSWQPIETAPKTGRTLLLGYLNCAGKWRTVRGQWMSEAYIAEYWEEPDDVEPGWFETSAEADDVPNCWRIEPTHWMPLPAAPQGAAQ